MLFEILDEERRKGSISIGQKLMQSELKSHPKNEPPRQKKKRKTAYAKTKVQISCAIIAQLISAFVFATRIVQPLFFLNPKFQACSLILWLYRRVCVGPGWIHKLLVFSCKGSMLMGNYQNNN